MVRKWSTGPISLSYTTPCWGFSQVRDGPAALPQRRRAGAHGPRAGLTPNQPEADRAAAGAQPGRAGAKTRVETSANGKQLCCWPGTAVKLIWPAVNPAVAGENWAI
jgi:hypothetical protein